MWGSKPTGACDFFEEATKVNPYMPLFTMGYICAIIALLFIPLAILKLFNVIEWSWIWVCSPLPAAFLLFYVTCISISFSRVKRKRARMIANGTYKRHPSAEKLAAILKIKLEEFEAQKK